MRYNASRIERQVYEPSVRSQGSPVAQLAERVAVNHLVAGSSPARGANSSQGDFPVPCFVYVLVNPEGKTYVGQTNDLERRVAQHNDPHCKGTLHTKRHKGPWKLIHQECLESRAEAMRRERELKSGKGRDWIKRELLDGC